jgi:2,3-bisphosphoglycerate-independent phosphoglycerate mutase
VDGAHLTLADGFKLLEARDFKFPIFEVDARKRDDVLLLVETLIASIEAELN